jgi:HSP90 family molecular chaperone
MRMSVDPASWVLISVPTWLKLVHTVGANLDERPVDEIWVGSVTELDGKPLQSVAKGKVDLDSEDDKAAHEAERQEQERDFADLLTWLIRDLE